MRFRKGEKPPAHRGSTGPVTAFEKLAAKDDPAAARGLRALPRAHAVRRSRPRTARAISRVAPPRRRRTIPRCLLAGELAENRNQRAIWIDRAEELAQAGRDHCEERIDVAPRARRRTRAAAPTGATRSRTTTRSSRSIRTTSPRTSPASSSTPRPGLRETALTLARAHARATAALASRSSARRAAALRELDRTTEAEELTEPLRAAPLRRHVGRRPIASSSRSRVAIADGAQRWIERLVDDEPGQRRARSRPRPAPTSRSANARRRSRCTGARSSSRPTTSRTLRALADVYALGGQADEQLRLLQARPRAPPAGEGRARVRRAHRAEPPARRRGVRAPVGRVPASSATQPANGRNRRTLVDLQVTTVFPNGLASRFHQVVFQPLTDAAAAEAREYAFSFEADTETVQLRGAQDLPQERPGRRGHRERRGPDRQPVDGDVLERARLLRALPAARPGRRRRAPLPRRGRRRARNAFADYFGEVVYMQSHEPIARCRVRAHHAEVAHVLLQQAERRRASCRTSRRRATRAHLALHAPRTSRRSSPSR